jgi:hypothetical protein
MVTIWLLLGAVKALLLPANNNQKVFCELLILAEGRSMKTGKRKSYRRRPAVETASTACVQAGSVSTSFPFAVANWRLWSSVTHKGLDSVRSFPDRTKIIRSSEIRP